MHVHCTGMQNSLYLHSLYVHQQFPYVVQLKVPTGILFKRKNPKFSQVENTFKVF